MMQTSRELKAHKKREMILNGSVWSTILMISLPIMFYNLCNYLYGIFDMMVVQKADIGEAADIVVLDQIKNMISTISQSLATAGGILVARIYGKKENDNARACANTLFTLGMILAVLTIVFIPIGVPFLKLLQTDQTTIDNALGYYNVQILILVLVTMNNVFIALEKSKGNTTKLFALNIGVIVIKIGLSSLFAFGPFENVTITWLAVATLIAQGFLFLCGLFFMFRKSNALRVTPKGLNLNKSYCRTLFKLALPIFVGRFLFNFGKVYVNSAASSVYGKDVVGALGISNTMAGLLSNMINSFEDGNSTIISQNYGAGNGRRIRRVFFTNMLYVSIIAVTGMLILFTLKENIAAFFAPKDLEYQTKIVEIFKWECMDIIFMGLNGIGMALFYGFGKTRITMTLSMSTLFAFRIPILLFLMYVVEYNYTACGIAMFASNALTGTISVLAATYFIKILPKNKKYPNLFA